MKQTSQRPVSAAITQQRESWTIGLAAAVIATGLLVSSGHARAESTFLNAAGTASARLNFSIVIPTYLYLQVGTGTAFANNVAVDTILFDMTPSVALIGNGLPQAGTGGDLLAGSVTARVLGNHFTAPVNLSATTTGAMSNGTDTISWSEISVAVPTAIVVTPAAAATLAHPGTAAAPFADGAATTVSLTPVNKVINQAAKWTFSYKNTNIPAAGTYGATVANKGQVTYQIAMP